MKPKEKPIQRVNAGNVATKFTLGPGESENPTCPADMRVAGMRSQYDSATSQTRKAYRHVLKPDAQKKCQTKAKRTLQKIEREDAAHQRRVIRAMLSAKSRGPASFKTL
jgi:hypothetical protein